MDQVAQLDFLPEQLDGLGQLSSAFLAGQKRFPPGLVAYEALHIEPDCCVYLHNIY